MVRQPPNKPSTRLLSCCSKNSWGSHWGEGGFMKLLRNVSDPLGQNGLLSLPPAYVIKEHANPGPHAVQVGQGAH